MEKIKKILKQFFKDIWNNRVNVIKIWIFFFIASIAFGTSKHSIFVLIFRSGVMTLICFFLAFFRNIIVNKLNKN